MTLTIDLTPEEEARLQRAASRRGLAMDQYLRELIDAMGEEEPLIEGQMPANGAELVAYWEREGLFGSRPDITDSLEHARAIRRKAERRVRE